MIRQGRQAGRGRRTKCERLTVAVGSTADVVDKYLAEGRKDYYILLIPTRLIVADT